MASSNQLSILSAYLEEKISDKGWSVKEFAEKADLNEKYAYELLSRGRDFTPSNRTVNKILKVLDLEEKEEKYILKLIEAERDKGKQLYPGDPDVPISPGEDDPPKPPPDPPPPLKDKPWYKDKRVIIALLIGLLVGILLGCCGVSVLVPFISESLNVTDYNCW